MAKVTSSDLNSANINNISNIELVSSTCSEMTNKISSFISSSQTVLTGGGYDAVRVKLNLYLNVVNTLKPICDNLVSNLKSCNNGMINYMEGYSELDDAKLPEINNRLAEIKGYLSYLYACASSSKNADYSASIAYWTSIYNELSHYRDLLSGLSLKDSSLYGSLSSTITDIANVCTFIESIDESTFTKDGIEAYKNGTGSLFKNTESISIKTGSIEHKEYNQKAWNDEVSAYCKSKGYPEWNNFGASGCGTCTAAEVYTNLLGREVTPFEVIDFMNQNYGTSKVTNSDALFTKLAHNYGLNSKNVYCTKDNTINCLMQGGQVATVMNGGAHYISITGYDKATDTFTIFDSYYTANGSGYKKMSWNEFVNYRNGSGVFYTIYPN